MKKYIKIITPLIPVIILLFAVWTITVILTSGKWYYSWQFKKNNTLDELTWVTRNGEVMTYTEEDLDEIATSITEYLFNKRDSMQVTINGHEFFSYQALEHMHQVKRLYNRWTIITIILVLITVPWFIYFSKHFKELKGLLWKPTVITYLIILGLLTIIGLAMAINFDWTFTNFHHILFWKKQNFDDAFFDIYSNYAVDNENPYINNLLLITVLDITVFMDAAWIILSYTVLNIISWFFISYKWKTKTK